jgi:drug/metabolite transporter (DMT)-like permease
MMAGALWGTVFLVPRLLPDFSPFLLSAGRYMMYGVVSLAVALPMARRLVLKLTLEDVGALVKLALIGNVAYYILLTASVHLVGIAPASLIIGVLPLTVTLAGRRDHGAIALKRLAWPLALVTAGIVCINLDVFAGKSEHSINIPSRLLGVLCALGALASWTWFAVANTRYLQRNTHFDGNEWSVLWGVVTGMLGTALWLAISAFPPGVVQTPGNGERWQLFWTLNLALAIGASWLGNGLWNAASKRLPLTLSGQMIVFETLFALLYGFLYDQRMPRALEIAAIALLLAGVSWSVRQHRNNGPAQAPLEQRAPAPLP